MKVVIILCDRCISTVQFHYFCDMQSLEILSKASELGTAISITNTFDPIFWLLMTFNLIVIAFVKTTLPNYIGLLFSTAINNRHLLTNTRDDLNLKKFGPILLNVCYFNAVSVCIYSFTPLLPSWVMLVFSGGLILLFLIKMLVINTIGFIRQEKSGIYEHLLNHFIFFQVSGIILTPLLIFTHYLSKSYLTSVSIGLLFILFFCIFIRELHSLGRAIQAKVSLFYIILYLCTLELLPLLVGIRVINLNIEVLN